MAEEYLMDSALLVDPENQGLNENCKCTICHNVFNKPRACANCLNHFCMRCIGRWQNTRPRECPLCKSYTEMRPVPLLLNILSKLQFHCPHQDSGCDQVVAIATQIISYDGFVPHSQSCQFESVCCRNQKCPERILRRDRAAHQDKCLFQLVDCKWCSATLELGKLAHHVEQCAERLEVCATCSETFKHQEYAGHQTACPYSEVGCKWCKRPSLRKELTDHEGVCQERRISCVGCRIEMSAGELYQHQNECELYPIVCQQCSQVLSRRDFSEHTLSNCLRFIKDESEKHSHELKRQNEQFRLQLKHYKKTQKSLLKMLGRVKPLSFSLFKKDPDIFVNGQQATVREYKKKRKDRYVLLEVDRLQSRPISWKVKVLTIKSQWFAVGICEESNLYLMKRYQSFGHSTYLVSANGTLYCTHDESENQKKSEFRLSCLDEVLCQYVPAMRIIRVTNLTKGITVAVSISLDEIRNKNYYPCLCLRCGGESAQLIDERADDMSAGSESDSV